ncbi:MAG: class I SAM-dependent methyltransferase [Fidelibacterota bacterium]|nr:MAG: class I SAM-dependent methyltransferase [Candidatus Neomarinimicrobiota bacterium]
MDKYNLEVLTEAKRYRAFLLDKIIRASNGARGGLDFGAGSGTFAIPLHAKGLRITCVEPDKHLLEKLQAAGLEAYHSLDQIPDQSCEYVYSLNVLEHVPDDDSILKEIFLKLIPGGRLFIFVPAFNLLYSSMDRKVGHLRRYNLQSILKKIKMAGFRSEEAAYADSLGFFVTLIYKWIGNRSGDINMLALKVFDSVIFPLSRFLDNIGLDRFFGKNLIVIARRPA